MRTPGEPQNPAQNPQNPEPEPRPRVVTNLRLPGQYDERLFAAAGISGLQGPYYNWNRWYLPSVGRYLELDPLALKGEFNSAFGIDWYNYAEGHPLTRIDKTGKASLPDPANDLPFEACLERGCPSTTTCPGESMSANPCILKGCNFGPRGRSQIMATGECYYRCRDGALPWKNMTHWGPGPTLGCGNKRDCGGN